MLHLFDQIVFVPTQIINPFPHFSKLWPHFTNLFP